MKHQTSAALVQLTSVLCPDNVLFLRLSEQILEGERMTKSRGRDQTLFHSSHRHNRVTLTAFRRRFPRLNAANPFHLASCSYSLRCSPPSGAVGTDWSIAEPAFPLRD